MKGKYMTPYEKAEAYDKALKRASIAHKDEDKHLKATLEKIFPELKESDDEKIKQVLIDLVKCNERSGYLVLNNVSTDSMISWLEKQGKVKHTCRNCQTFQDMHQNCPYSPIHQYTDLKEAHKHLDDETRCDFWLEKHGEHIDEEEILIGARKRIALSIMDFLDMNTLGMCLSSMECKGLEDAVVGSDWRAVYNYMKKKLERQSEQPNKVSIWKHWNNGSIGGNGDGKLIYLVKSGNTYSLSSCLGFECDYIELSELDKLYVEKQGEQKSADKVEPESYFYCKYGDTIPLCSDCKRNYINSPFKREEIPTWYRPSKSTAARECEDYIACFEKQSEQSYEKIEPRFKVGDVVIWDGEEYTIEKVRENTYRVGGYDCPIYTQDEFILKPPTKFNVGDFIVSDYCMGKVIELTDDAYLLDSGQGIPFSCEHNAHLWTIQDAKDGDVLATNNDDICIFDGTVEEGKYPFAYCGVTERGFEFYDGKLPFTHANVQPATKEQRDILFQKMKEAGYEWDNEKRELRKIEHEQNPADKSDVKFKGGDWVVNGKGETAYITEVVSDFYGTLRYHIEWANGYTSDPTLCFVDKNYHLWTIKDAKKGDVLVASDGSIFLFAGVDDYACKYYAVLTNDNNIKINKDVKGGYWETSRAVHPAIKEQRELLFQKMKEEGYEWDGEKRELINIL